MAKWDEKQVGTGERRERRLRNGENCGKAGGSARTKALVSEQARPVQKWKQAQGTGMPGGRHAKRELHGECMSVPSSEQQHGDLQRGARRPPEETGGEISPSHPWEVKQARTFWKEARLGCWGPVTWVSPLWGESSSRTPMSVDTLFLQKCLRK